MPQLTSELTLILIGAGIGLLGGVIAQLLAGAFALINPGQERTFQKDLAQLALV